MSWCCPSGSANDDVMARLANQDTASMLSFSSSTNAASSSSSYRSQQQQLGTKVRWRQLRLAGWCPVRHWNMYIPKLTYHLRTRRILWPFNVFHSAQRLDLFAWCIRLSWLSVVFPTHFKSTKFHCISSTRGQGCHFSWLADGYYWPISSSIVRCFMTSPDV